MTAELRRNQLSDDAPGAKVPDPLLGAIGGDVTNAPKKATAVQTALNLTTAALGSGILSLPWAGAGASVGMAVALTGFALLLNGWTTLIVVEAGEKYQVFDLGGLLALLPGRLGTISQVANNVLIFASQCLCLVSYCTIVGDAVFAVLPRFRTLGIVIFALFVLPVSFASMRYLAFTSTLAIAVVFYIFGYLVYLSFADPLYTTAGHELCVFGVAAGTVSMFSALINGTILQVFVLPIYAELENRSVAKFRRVMFASFTFIFVLYTGFLFAGLGAFGRVVKSNVLNSMPDGTPATIARVSMSVVMLGVYPINVKPMTAMIRDKRLTFLTTVIVVGTTLGVALAGVELGVINTLNGALEVGAFVTIGPALVAVYALQARRCPMLVLMVFGAVLSAVGLFVVDNYVNDLVASCLIW